MSNIAKVFSFSNGVTEKREELQKMSQILKGQFVGLDDVIDKITKLMEPWRIMPGAQNRPVIINLWGMTGTGKTSLVRKIANILQTAIIQIDLGEFSDKNFSVDFYEKYSDWSDKECIILLDEIQNCRTIEMFKEIDRPSLRGLWSLLSDGKIIPDKRISKEYYMEEIQEAMELFVACKGVNPNADSNDKTMEDSPEPEKVVSSDSVVFDPYHKSRVRLENEDETDRDERPPWTISNWTISSILRLCKKIKYTKLEMLEKLEKDFLPNAEMLLNALNELDIQPQLNYQKSIIFIAGNLDEIYMMSKSANPDITPDTLYENSKKITVPIVKNSLLQRFRPEQVARFGNNHVIYPAFSEKDFRDIIRLDLNRIQENTLEQYDVNLHFDQSVDDLIYSEGVFPTQGARPVLSTISTLVEASIPSCLKEIITQYEDKPLNAPINVKMSLNSDNALAIFELNDNDKLINKEKVFLSIESLRKPIYDDEHVSIAIHEAGHTICQLVEFGEYPTKVCAFSPNVNSEGYMERKSNDFVTKEALASFITVALGGFVAEKQIFGETNITTGASNDIYRASCEAAAAIQSLGFGDLPIFIQRKSVEDNLGIEYNPETDRQIQEFTQKCLAKAEDNIGKNKKLLLDIAGELLNQPHLIEDDIDKILKRNNFKLKENIRLTNLFEKQLEKEEISWTSKYKETK